MNKKLLYGLVGVAVLFFVVTLVVFLSSGKESPAPSSRASEGAAASQGEQADTVDLKLFYMDPGDWRLVPMTLRVPRPAVRTDLYREFLRLLLQPREGVTAPVPEGIALRALYYLKTDRMLVVDFNQALITNFPAGTRTELEFIRFIVDNVCWNFREIESVRFMVAGNEVKTLSGHIDLSRPFRPNFAYLQQDEQ